MINKTEIEQLKKSHNAGVSRVLSVYLDIDPSRNQGYKHDIVLKSALKFIREDLDPKDIDDFHANAEAIKRYLVERPSRARSLVFFSDIKNGFFWVRELMVHVRNQAVWEDRPAVKQLFELFDEYERFAVILADRGQARIFIFFMGEIEELVHSEAEVPPYDLRGVRHVKTSGTDHLWSQMKNQRHADMHGHWHLSRVADLLAEQLRYANFSRIILSGPQPSIRKLEDLLSKELKARVAGTVQLSIHAKAHEVLNAVQEAAARIEREKERLLVDDLITLARKDSGAVLGIRPVLDALHDGQIGTLVYREGLALSGSYCTGCETFQAKNNAVKCENCGGEIRPIQSLVAAVADQASRMQARIEEVRGEAAEILDREGSIGGFLRFTYSK